MAHVTPNRGWSTPDEYADPYWAAFTAFADEIDADVQALFDSGHVIYQGTWNASTNTPSLASGVGSKGHYYVVAVAGSTSLDGETDWQVGDWAIYNGAAWQKVDNTQTGTTMDTAYNNFGSDPATVVVDGSDGQGDLKFDLTDAHSFDIDLGNTTGSVDGFRVYDGEATEYWRLLRKNDNAIDLEAALQNVGYATSGNFDVDAAGFISLDADAPSNLTVDGADLTVSAVGGGDLLMGSEDNLTVQVGDTTDMLAVNQASFRSGSTGAAITGVYANSTGTGNDGLTTLWASSAGSSSAADSAVVQVYSTILSGSAKSYLWLGSQGGGYETHETYLRGANVLDISCNAGPVNVDASGGISIDGGGDSNFTATYASSAVAAVQFVEIASTIAAASLSVTGDNTYPHNVTIGAENVTGNASVIVDAKSNLYLGGTTGYALDGSVHIGTVSTSSARTINIGEDGTNSRASTINMRGGATINVANEAYATTLNLGTGAAAQTVTLGSATASSSTTVQAGNGNVLVQALPLSGSSQYFAILKNHSESGSTHDGNVKTIVQSRRDNAISSAALTQATFLARESDSASNGKVSTVISADQRGLGSSSLDLKNSISEAGNSETVITTLTATTVGSGAAQVEVSASSTSGSSYVRLGSADELRLEDNNRTGWTQTYMTLSDAGTDWSNFKTAFGGEVSLLSGVYQARNMGLDEAYDKLGTGAGKAITADQGAVSITVPNTASNAAFTVDQQNTSTIANGVEISSSVVQPSLTALTGSALKVSQTSAGAAPALEVNAMGAGPSVVLTGTSVNLGIATIDNPISQWAVAQSQLGGDVQATFQATAVTATGSTSTARVRVLTQAIRNIGTAGNADCETLAKIDHASASGVVNVSTKSENNGTGASNNTLRAEIGYASNSSDANVYIQSTTVGTGAANIDIDAKDAITVDSTDLTLQATTSQKIGLWGATPIVRPSAYTQTYSTADKTISAYTPDDESGAYTGIDNAQVGTVYAQLTDLNALRTAYENLRGLSEDIAQALNAVIDDLQAMGAVG